MTRPDSVTGTRRIAVVGSGYVGTVVGSCLARFGHDVVALEADPTRFTKLQSPIAPRKSCSHRFPRTIRPAGDPTSRSRSVSWAGSRRSSFVRDFLGRTTGLVRIKPTHA